MLTAKVKAVVNSVKLDIPFGLVYILKLFNVKLGSTGFQLVALPNTNVVLNVNVYEVVAATDVYMICAPA